MADEMTRITVRLKEETRRRMMSLALSRGIYKFSVVLREAMGLWIAREEIRPQTDEWLAMADDDSDVYASSAINLLEHILEAGQK